MGAQTDGAEAGARLPSEPDGGPAVPRPREAAAGSVALPAKLRPPRLHVALVPRLAAVTALIRSREQLVLFSAPPGSGKTVVLLQWAAAESKPVAWLRLDPGDNDPHVLLQYLAAALASVPGAETAELTSLLRRRHQPSLQRALPELGAAVAAARPFLLVLDDCQYVKNTACWDIVELLLSELPERAQLALATRADPPLPLGRIRARGDLLELRFGELALDRGEVAELLRLHGVHVDEPTLSALLDLTEGWATGLYLALLASRDVAPGEVLRHVRGDQRDIAAYLLGEVLDREPRDLQTFLLETSILDELSAPLCAAVTGRDDAGEVLAKLARDNAFVMALDDCGVSFRYHRLFAELLYARLEQARPGDAPALHRAAAHWYEGNGDPERAVRHWLATGDVAATVVSVGQVCGRYLQAGRAESARRLLRLFSEEQLLSYASLAVCAGWAFAAGAPRSDEQRHWVRLLRGLRFDDAPACDGASSLRSSYTLLMAELAPEGLTPQRELFKLAVSLETQPGTFWYDLARLGYGRSLYLTGFASSAEEALRALLAETVDAEMRALACATLALVAADDGRWGDVGRWLEEAERALPCLDLDGHPGFCALLPLHLAHARLQSHRAHPGTMKLAQLVGDHLDTMIPDTPWMALWATVTLAEVACERNNLEAARAWAERASTLLMSYEDAGVLVGRTLLLRERLGLRDGLVLLTPAERRVLELLPTGVGMAEIARRLYVSRNTVKTHTRLLYRKLGVRSRDEATARARELGLLDP